MDKGSHFYNRPIKPWLQDNDIEMYSTYNEEKSVIALRFIRPLEKNIYKYMNSLLIYIDKLDDIVNKYSNTYDNI